MPQSSAVLTAVGSAFQTSSGAADAGRLRERKFQIKFQHQPQIPVGFSLWKMLSWPMSARLTSADAAVPGPEPGCP